MISTRWVTLEALQPGSLFETKDGIRAVKSEYRMTSQQCECILLGSGEYAHFTDKNDTLVRKIAVRGRIV